MLLSPVFFFMLIAENTLLNQLSLGVFLIAAITDWYDGEIARRSGTVTNVARTTASGTPPAGIPAPSASGNIYKIIDDNNEFGLVR